VSVSPSPRAYSATLPRALDERLAFYRDLTLERLKTVVPVREPRRYLYDAVAAQLGQTGKGLRPALCIATCAAFGGDVDLALNSAVALELLHNAFLVHDDLEDGSHFRRDRPTLYRQLGIPIAVNVGDALLALSLRPLLENISVLGAELAWRIVNEVEYMLRQSLEGQAMELGWVRDNACDVTEDDYLHMVLKKTAWYTCIQPCRIGALVATGNTTDLDRFNRFGYYLGTAFQVQDDLLNLVGDDSRYGKEIMGDLWEGKRTLLLIHLLQSCTPYERARVQQFLGEPRTRRTERSVRWVRTLMDRYGCLDYVRHAARQLAEAARREFEVAYRGAASVADREFIAGLVAYVVERDA
jgi:geranylgeranyl diphosphate synthase type II